MKANGGNHQYFLSALTAFESKPKPNEFLNRYLGCSHPFYPLTTPELREIAKHWSKENKSMSYAEFEATIDSLSAGISFQEKALCGLLLDYNKAQREKIRLSKIRAWLLTFEGWAEIDCMASGRFTAKEQLGRWQEWEPFLVKLSVSKSIQHRRASLVLLTKALGQQRDARLSTLAFELILTLTHEKDILITKAISWVLRSMSKHYASEVKRFLIQYEEHLPAIALRETRRKLETGRK